VKLRAKKEGINKDKDTTRAVGRPLAKMAGLRPLAGSLVSLLSRIHYERKGLTH